MQIRLSQGLAAAAGVMLFDFLFCQVIAPKVFEVFGLAPNARADRDCHCARKECGCSWQKNVTDQGEVIDITPVTQFDRLRLLN